MLDIITNIGNFGDVKSLMLEMRYNNINKVEVEIKYSLEVVKEKTTMTFKEVEDLVNFDNNLFWENEFISKIKNK